MTIKVIAFGQIAEIAGKTNWELKEIKNTEQLAGILVKEFPVLKNLPFRFAVNLKLVHVSTEFQEDDVVALLPPFSGG
jgi:molybdopterin converting factor small subunit